MTENTNATTENTAPAAEKKPRVVKHIDVRIEELREDIAERQAKLEALLRERSSRDAVANLKRGDAISFEYGRAESKRVESGTILAVATNDKGVTQFNVLVGEGLESKTLIVAASAVILPEGEAASAE